MQITDFIEDKYKSISIIGTAKNAGKTVTLNRIIEEAYYKDINIAITSTGRDGETRDVLTNTEKPSIFVKEGTIITTAIDILKHNDNLEIIEITDYRSPLGNIIIAKLKEDGYVQIAGPVTNNEMKEIINKLLELGVSFVLIDGSINRKSSASPSVSDACILCTGAEVSRDMNKVIEEAYHLKNLFDLESININNEVDSKVSLIDFDNNIINLDLKTSINSGNIIAKHITENTKYILFNGSLVKKTALDILKNTRYRNFKFVVKDATRIFINSKDWMSIARDNVEIKVLDKINLIAITLNPHSTQGYYFNSKEFLSKARSFIKDIPVIDVLNI